MTIAKQIVARLQEHTKLEAMNADEAGKALKILTKLFGVAPKRAMYQGDSGKGANGTVYFAPVMVGNVPARVTVTLVEGKGLKWDIAFKGGSKEGALLTKLYKGKDRMKLKSCQTFDDLLDEFATTANNVLDAYTVETDYKTDAVSKTLAKWGKVG